jgi:hypothetical protein
MPDNCTAEQLAPFLDPLIVRCIVTARRFRECDLDSIAA